MINQSVCASFKKELFEAVHNFGVAPDIFMLALYTSSARLDFNTTAYSTVGEVVGPQYTAGGEILSILQAPTVYGSQIMLNFHDLLWPVGISVITRGALIYNSTKANRAVLVIDFGLDINTSTSGKFGITFPPHGQDMNPAILVAR